MRFAARHTTFIAVAGLVALLATGAAYAEGVLGGQDRAPVIRAGAGATPVPEYPGWSYAAATSTTGAACIVLTTPSGEGRTCAEPNTRSIG